MATVREIGTDELPGSAYAWLNGNGQGMDRRRVSDFAIHDDGVDVIMGESFIDYSWDQATHDKVYNFLVLSHVLCQEALLKLDPLHKPRIPSHCLLQFSQSNVLPPLFGSTLNP